MGGSVWRMPTFYFTIATIILNYPEKLEVRFYDGAGSITPVAVARCTGAEKDNSGDLIFNP